MERSPWIIVSGLDGAGKTSLRDRIVKYLPGDVFSFKMPYNDFVHPALEVSGNGYPMDDTHTDELIFALDARLTNYEIKRWREKYDYVVSQRGWPDHFIFGAMRGIRYKEEEKLLKTDELEKPSVIILLTADPEIAYRRIEHDPDADKYETPEILEIQHEETKRFSMALGRNNKALKIFEDVPNVLIDTTKLTQKDTFEIAKSFLAEELYLGFD